MSPDPTRREGDCGQTGLRRRSVRPEASYLSVERRLLCERIAALERELERERQRRRDVIEQYERLLHEREETSGERGFLPGLLGSSD